MPEVNEDTEGIGSSSLMNPLLRFYLYGECSSNRDDNVFRNEKWIGQYVRQAN